MKRHTTLLSKTSSRKINGKKSRVRSSYHNPRLDTVEMVEDLIQQRKEFDSKHQVWRSLPKQIQYQTFSRIMNYLERSNKIMYDNDGAVVWIFGENPKLQAGSIRLR